METATLCYTFLKMLASAMQTNIINVSFFLHASLFNDCFFPWDAIRLFILTRSLKEKKIQGRDWLNKCTATFFQPR